jgi:hypothetical protein
MNGLILSILPSLSPLGSTFSRDRSKAVHAKLLITKTTSLLFIITFYLTGNAFSQAPIDNLSKIDSCFLAVKMDLKTNSPATSKGFCVGDKITVKLKGDKIHGKITKLSKNHIVVADKHEIDVSEIKWIKKSKLTASRAIAGTLVTLAGVALIPASQEAATFDETGFLLLAGTALVPTGIIILVSRTKFRIERGDKLIFQDESGQGKFQTANGDLVKKNEQN